MKLSPEKQLETLCDLLIEGHNQSEHYLNWASEFYQLPSLDSEFFQQVDITETWKKYNSFTRWSPEFLPIQEWDNRLMIACPFPPSDFKPQFEISPQFVLASPLDLKRAFEKLQKAPAAEVLAPKTSEAHLISETKELAMNFDFKIDESFKAIDFSVDDVQIDHGAATENSDAPPVAQAAPEGIILNFELPKEETSAPKTTTFEMPEPDKTLRVQNQSLDFKSPPPQKKPTVAPGLISGRRLRSDVHSGPEPAGLSSH